MHSEIFVVFRGDFGEEDDGEVRRGDGETLVVLAVAAVVVVDGASARTRSAPLAHHVRLRQTIGVAFARAFALAARRVIHLESAERDGVHELIDGLLRRGARRYRHTRLAVRQYVDIARADDVSSRPFASRKRSAGTTLRGVSPMLRHSVSISRGKASPRTNVTKYRDLSRRRLGPRRRCAEMQRRHPRRQRREDVSVRARVRRALVHLTPERLHQKFLAEVRTLPREMARDALLERLVRVRKFRKRVLREEIRQRVLAPAPSPSSKDATAVRSATASSRTDAEGCTRRYSAKTTSFAGGTTVEPRMTPNRAGGDPDPGPDPFAAAAAAPEYRSASAERYAAAVRSFGE